MDVPKVSERSNSGVGWLLRHAAYAWPDHVALVCRDDRLTFAALLDWVDVVSAQLHEAGVRPGDCVLSQMVNSVESVVLQYATWQIGAVSTPVLPLLRSHELRQVMRATKARALVGSGRPGGYNHARGLADIELFESSNPVVRWLVGTETVEGWDKFPERPGDRVVRFPEDACWFAPAGLDENCLVLFTSGTTAAPKGVCHTSRSLRAEACTYRDAAGLNADSALLVPGPLSHVGSAVAATVTTALTGAKAVLLERWDAVEAVETCDRESVTFSVAVPLFLKEMADLYETSHREVSRPARIAVGGASTPPDLIERADRLGIFAWRGWGMSEAPSLTVAFPDDRLHMRATTDGRLDIGTQVEAVDSSRTPLPVGVAGELRVRSPKQMVSYLDPDQTAGQVDDSGWFYTGDVGSVDSDGWVAISGRIKDIVNRGGEKFSAVEIEAAIAGHADVEQVAVVGVPHERLGETVAAFVVLRRGCAWQGPEALNDHVRSTGLARQKFPEHWVVVDALPVNATGKVRKDLLRNGWMGLSG